MQKSDVFFKDFKISFIVAGLAFTVFFAMAANYWISRPPILVRGLPLIPIPSRPLKLKKISFYF